MTYRTMRVVRDSAAELLRTSFTHAGIEEVFADRFIPFSEGTPKHTFVFNTLDALPRARFCSGVDYLLKISRAAAVRQHNVAIPPAPGIQVPD